MTMTSEPQATTDQPELKEGRVVAIAGPVVDVEFPQQSLPEINHAVEMDIEIEGTAQVTVTAEVAQQIGARTVRDTTPEEGPAGRPIADSTAEGAG